MRFPLLFFACRTRPFFGTRVARRRRFCRAAAHFRFGERAPGSGTPSYRHQTSPFCILVFEFTHRVLTCRVRHSICVVVASRDRVSRAELFSSSARYSFSGSWHSGTLQKPDCMCPAYGTAYTHTYSHTHLGASSLPRPAFAHVVGFTAVYAERERAPPPISKGLGNSTCTDVIYTCMLITHVLMYAPAPVPATLSHRSPLPHKAAVNTRLL